MTSARLPREHLLPPARMPGREVGVWGMAMFCATEAALFAYLLSSYFYLAVSNPDWPPAGIDDPKLTLPLLMTVALVSSSVAVYWAERGIRLGRERQLRLGTTIAVVLGLVFIALQGREYADKLRHFGPQTHAYAASFFTITGFHGAHVIFGVLALGYMLVRAVRHQFTADHHVGVSVVALYWHTVDVIWLAILSCLYVSPRFY